SSLSSVGPPPAISTCCLHDALPIFARARLSGDGLDDGVDARRGLRVRADRAGEPAKVEALGLGHVRTAERRKEDAIGRAERALRSEEHTSELQSRENLVCRLLLETK